MNSLRLILSDRRYFAPIWLFACLNIVVSTWVLYVPAVKDRLGIDAGDLGVALLCFSLGLMTAIPVSSVILRRVGLGRGSVLAGTIFSLAMCVPVSVTTYPQLITALFVSGFFGSLLDIGMNAMVSEIEARDDVHIMAAAHGFFSLGGVIGAGIGSLLIGYFTTPAIHMLLVAAFLLFTNLFLARAYWNMRSPEVDRGEGGKFNWRLVRPLLGLTVLAVLIMGSEGAVEHWSKLYLLDVVRVDSDQLAGLGFVIFSALMTTGRFLGDGISSRYGSLAIIIGGTLVAAVGFAFTLLGDWWSSLLGFGLVGLGFSVIIPELFRLAGRTPGVSAAEGISVVAGFGYVGLIGGPAVLGFLADWGTLRLSFAALLGATLLSAGIGYYLLLRQRTRAGL